MVESSKRLKPWRQNVAREAAIAWAGKPLYDGPVSIEYLFIAARPKRLRKVFKRLPKNPVLREWPVSRQVGDLEKLIRAVNDSLTGTVLLDDSQVAEFGRAAKVYDYDEPPGVRVNVRALGSAP